MKQATFGKRVFACLMSVVFVVGMMPSMAWATTADIATDIFVGSQANPFTGHLDGNGKTLTVNVDYSSIQGAAPFNYISGATIENLSVAGTVLGSRHSAGLVGFAQSGSNTIRNVTVLAEVNGSEYAGGIVGRSTATLTLDNCVFAGTIKSANSYAGGLLGWSDGGALTVSNSLYNGAYTGNGMFHPVALKDGGASVAATDNGAYYDSAASITAPDEIVVISGTAVYGETSVPAVTKGTVPIVTHCHQG